MERAERMPSTKGNTSYITSDDWAQLCDGSIWRLDQTDLDRWGYKDLNSMKTSIHTRGRMEGPKVRVSIDRTELAVYVQAEQ